MSTTDKSFLQTILSLLDVLSSHKTEGRSWIHLLSLLCIFTILNQPEQSPASTASSTQSANPLQKLLGDLTKGASQGGGLGGADTLLSLLPLLNNPQIKSKLNPNNIAAMMNVVQSLAGTATPTPAKNTAPEPQPASMAVPPATPQPTSSAPPLEAPPAPPSPPVPPLSPTAPTPQSSPPTPAPTNRYLDWKSSF